MKTKLIALACLATTYSHAMLPVTEDAQHTNVSFSNSRIGEIHISDRLAAVKDIISAHPGMLMRTLVPELNAVWNDDIRFMIGAVESQTNRLGREMILGNLRQLETWAADHTEKMSFAHLNFCCYLAASVLSGNSFENISILQEEYIRKYNNDRNDIKLTLHDSNYINFLFQDKQGKLIVPHVSASGLRTILDINNALAFSVNEQGYSVSYITIGTNPQLSYEASNDLCADRLWENEAGRIFSVYNSETQESIDDIVNLKKILGDSYNEPEVQAFFYRIYYKGSYGSKAFSPVFAAMNSDISFDQDNIKKLRNVFNKKGVSYAEMEWLYQLKFPGLSGEFFGATDKEKVDSCVAFYQHGIRTILEKADMANKSNR